MPNEPIAEYKDLVYDTEVTLRYGAQFYGRVWEYFPHDGGYNGYNAGLPPGLRVDKEDAGHVIKGKPTKLGYFHASFVTENLAGDDRRAMHLLFLVDEYSIKIDATKPLPGVCYMGQTYTGTVKASGGKPPYTYILDRVTGNIHVILDSTTGEFALTASEPGKFFFDVGAHDRGGSGAHSEREVYTNGWMTYSGTIGEKHTTIQVGLSQTPPDCMIGDKYPEISIIASGGVEPYTYTMERYVMRDRNVPGLKITGNVLSGTPTKDGEYYIHITATDKVGNTGHIDCHFWIFSTLMGAFNGDKHATVGVEYKGKIFGYGGYPPVHLEMNLPEGLRLDPYVMEGQVLDARVVGKPTKAVVDFPLKPYAIDSKGTRTALEADPDKLTVAPAKQIGSDLALGKLLHGQFALDGGGEDLTITGEVSGGGLSETNKPDNVVLQIKQPDQSTFVDAKNLGTLNWETRWKADGWEFTLSGIKWSAQKDVPRFEIKARLDSHTSKPAIVRFPLSEFVRNLAFQDDAGEPLSGAQVTVKPGPQTLHLHMAFYNALDQLTAKLVLPDGITRNALLSAVIVALPNTLKVRPDWNGHTQTVLFEISKEHPLVIASGTHQTVNLSIPVDVETTFRSGEATCELSSSSDIVENILNTTKPERATLSVTASTS